jgi:hypothetical protein
MDQEIAQPPQLRKLGGAAVNLAPIKSYAERWDIAAAAGVNVTRAAAAALGLAWPRLRKMGPAYRGDAIAYGGEVIDYLIEHGSPYGEIVAVAVDALRLATDGLISEGEVKERADFSEASRDGSTS